MIHENSQAAYHCADRKKNAESQQAEILKIVKENPELTSSEISLKTKTLFAVWKRLPELRSQGHVHNPYTRSCEVSGKKAMVWAVAV